MNDNVLYYVLCIIGLILMISGFFIITKDDNQ
jgi:hypothetical protein